GPARLARSLPVDLGRAGRLPPVGGRRGRSVRGRPVRMPAHSQGFRSEALTRALDDAVAGDARALYDLLARVGGLPGPRANAGVVLAFANECAARGTKADALVAQMATLDVDAAPGASKYEI